MPVFGNITIKKADGTSDIVYTAVQKSAGDGSPARYEQQTPSVLSARPQFAIQSSKPPGSGNLRRMTFNGVYPILDVDGKEVGRVTLSDAKVTTPRNADATSVKEGVHQLLNLCASAASKQSAEEGYAP